MKQKDTKNELMQELFQLSLESHKQQQHLNNLRTALQPTPAQPKPVERVNRMREYQQSRSKSKGRGLLFNSGALGKTPSRLVLKKCKSSGMIDTSEYFPEGMGSSQRKNPESALTYKRF